jgi:hypothetical protein
MAGSGVCGVYMYREGVVAGQGRANGKRSGWDWWVDAQPVVEGGGI